MDTLQISGGGGGVSIGGAISGGTAGRVLFVATGPIISDSANFLYSESSGPRLQVGSGTAGNMGLTFGNLTSGESGIWSTRETPSTTNYILRYTNLETYIGAAGHANGAIHIRPNGSDTIGYFGGGAGRGLLITAFTATTDVNALNVQQTWNASGVAFTGCKFTITDTASAAGSLVAQFLVGASGTTHAFSVNKSSQALFADGSKTVPSIALNSDTTTGFFSPASSYIEMATGGKGVVTFSDGVLNLNGTIGLNANGTDHRTTAPDTSVGRISAGLIGVGTGAAGSFAGSLQLTGIELGHASDTTLSRSAAGVLAVEGVVIPSISSTNTLTNKRVTKRTGTVASSATPTINTDNVDEFSITALAANITSMTTNLSGTPVEGDTLTIWFKDDGTSRTIAWGASFLASSDLALPTATTLGKYLYTAFKWNATAAKWLLLAKLDNF